LHFRYLTPFSVAVRPIHERREDTIYGRAEGDALDTLGKLRLF
jgi:hypothetical protein